MGRHSKISGLDNVCINTGLFEASDRPMPETVAQMSAFSQRPISICKLAAPSYR